MKLTIAGRVAVVVVALAGCDAGRGDVSGIVTLNGAPLPGGMVTFVAANGQAETGRISADGTYSVPNFPAGPARITVITQPPVRLNENGPAIETLGKYVAIPQRYRDPEQSGLTCDVKRGPQQCDLPLQQ
jgi:hypothetical protein